MPKLAIMGTIQIVPGRKRELLPLLMAHKARCLKDEPGTLRFEVFAPREDEGTLLLCEIYRDDAAFDAHRAGRSITQFREESAGIIVKIEVTRCALVE